MIGYWNRLIHSKICLLHSSNTPFKWTSHIERILVQLGKPDIWMLQQNVHIKSLSYTTKKILTTQIIQSWPAKDIQSSKSMVYFCFKLNINLEKYFISLPFKQYISLFKFRTGSHKLPIETCRWGGIDIADRKYLLCPLNDEFHYIRKCSYFLSERKTYIKPYYYTRPDMFKFAELFKSENKSILINLSKFINIILRAFK